MRVLPHSAVEYKPYYATNFCISCDLGAVSFYETAPFILVNLNYVLALNSTFMCHLLQVAEAGTCFSEESIWGTDRGV